VQARPKALAIAAFGARGTGKTAWVLQQIQAARPKRLLVWDFKHDPPLDALGPGIVSLVQVRALAQRPKFSARFLVDHSRDVHAQFDLFCRIAWDAGDLLMFVDELPEVTKANKAPPAWRRCVNVGRLYRDAQGQERSLSIIGAGQRPAECDKSFVSNCDVIHTGRLTYQDDAKAMAALIGCDAAQLTRLPDLHWVERRAGQVDFLQGKLSFSGKKTTAKPTTKTMPKASA
jgi:hypothetical protein